MQWRNPTQETTYIMDMIGAILLVLLYRWVTRLVVFEKVKWQTVILRGIWDQFLANQN